MGNVIWLTGLSGSGKTTLAKALLKELRSDGSTGVLIDGDKVRNSRQNRLGFTRSDIERNGFQVIDLCEKERLVSDYVIVAVITPFEVVRTEARTRLQPNYYEVFVSTSLDLCKRRDTKGLYRKAELGEIQNLVGVSGEVPFETPKASDITIDTHQVTVEEASKKMLSSIRKWIDGRKLKK
ncbi:MAG: adenylyl-sulfate kinase [Gemmatimonadetes bacterium]|nr:adenylyl-sulfate kinase [Gemmatimonadota bacterium]